MKTKSLTHYTKGTLLLYIKAPTVFKLQISGSFQTYLVLFTFPLRYLCTIGY